MLPTRKPTRIKGYDYSNQNIYFITICTHNHKYIFTLTGENSDRSSTSLNELGMIAKSELESIPNHYEGIRVDKCVVMPNHIHAMIVIGCNDPAAERSRPFPTLSTIVGLYKSGISKRIHAIDPSIEVWQKSFHDHIIRNDREYQKIWQYIEENPLKWMDDCFYSA